MYKELKNDGFTVIGSALEESERFPINVVSNKIALVVGNEGSGISKFTKESADKIVRIDMASDMESLNVGVAASILMYYFSPYSH